MVNFPYNARARPLVERHGTGNDRRICADRRPALAASELSRSYTRSPDPVHAVDAHGIYFRRGQTILLEGERIKRLTVATHLLQRHV
jgi:hypothetical protein